MKVNDFPLTLKVDEVAKILRISKNSAYLLSKRKDFPSIQAGKRILVPRDAFFNWLNQADNEEISGG